jgi:hypothetical protein
MAKVSFTTGDGEPQSFRLLNHRPVRIGRDPANDIVLRDAKVSRAHAEIVFERGFFVLHDLASANGSFVNGVRVRVAPLTDGAELKLGGSFGFFTEELPDSPQHTVASPLEGLPKPPSAPEEAAPPPSSPPHAADEEEVGTAEHPKNAPPTFGGLLTQHDASMASIPIQDPPMFSERQRMHVEQARDVVVDASSGDRLAVRRSDDGSGLFHFRRPALLANLAANLLAGVVFLSGIAVALFLLLERIYLPATLAFGLALVFTLLIVSLAPKRVLTLYQDESMAARALVVRQERSLPLPKIRFHAESASGEEIGVFERYRIAPLRRRKWRLLRRGGVEFGVARERTWSAVIMRLLTLNFVAAFRPQYDVDIDGSRVASIDRANGGMKLTFRHSAATGLDTRAPIALAVIVTVLDR